MAVRSLISAADRPLVCRVSGADVVEGVTVFAVGRLLGGRLLDVPALDGFAVDPLPVVAPWADAGGALLLLVGGATTPPVGPVAVGADHPAEDGDTPVLVDTMLVDTMLVRRAPVDRALGMAAVNVVGPATVEVQAASETRATAPRMHKRFCDMKSPERWQRQTANDTGVGSFQE